MLLKHGICISMDGKSGWLDISLAERPRR